MPQILGIITLILLYFVTSLNLTERSFYEVLQNTKVLTLKDYTFSDKEYCEATDKDSNTYLGSCSEGFFFPQDKITNEIIVTCDNCDKNRITSSGSVSIIGGEIGGPIRAIPGYFKPNTSSALLQSYEFEGDVSAGSFFLTGSINQSGKDGIIKSILTNLCSDADECNNLLIPNMENLILEREGDELYIYHKNLTPGLTNLYFRLTTTTSDESQSTEVQYIKKD